MNDASQCRPFGCTLVLSSNLFQVVKFYYVSSNILINDVDLDN